MKMTIILLTITFLHASAGTLAQTVTLSVHEKPLEDVFTSVEKQTGYVFFYDGALLKGIRPVSISASNLNIPDFLGELLKGLPLDYIIEKKTILIKKKNPVPGPAADSPPPYILFGHVTDSLGRPLAGASVFIRGTKKGVQTDEHGGFTLPNINGDEILEISFTAYEKATVRVNHQPVVIVVLKINQSPLDQTIVQAYGTTSRRFSVGATAVVNAKDIEKQPVTNVLLALQGQAPGLAISANNGAPGSSVQVQIRGQNSLRSSLYGLNPYDQPLFIVDGVPLAAQNQNINLLSSLGAGNYGNGNPYGGISPINGINPADIESISILKDADATSIYGTQGANGVILITTKKGRPGKTDLNLSISTGPNKATRQVQMMNTQQYLQYLRESLQNAGINPATADPLSYPELRVFDTTRYTDWFHELFGKTSNNTDVHASLSGGAENTTFIFSAGYTRATYNFPGDFADNRLTLHSGLRHNSNDHRLTIEFGTDYSYDHNNSSAKPSVGTAMLLPPDLPALTDPDGKLVWNYKGVNLSSYPAYSYLKQPNDLQSHNMNNTLHLAYRLAQGLSLSVNAGYSRLSTTETSQYPISSLSPGNTTGQAQFGNSTYQTINIEPQADYKRRIGKGMLSVLAGAAYKKNTVTSSNAQGNGYSNDALLGSLSSATSITFSDNSSIYKYNAVYGRIGYIYDQKYIVNLTGRRDGSSNFGPGHQFGNFGSAGMGWIFSEEGNFKKALPFVSYAKLSANYGTNGSDGITAYQYQSFWSPPNYTPLFQNVRPYSVQNLYNPDYSWDTKKALNLGLDIGFFHDRLLVNATWYRNRIGNQLVNYNLPDQTGFPSVLQNFTCTVQNTGWEFTVASTNIKRRDFSWSTNFNITINDNKITAFPDLANSPYASTYTIGKSTSTVNGYKYKDVNDTTGIFEFYTQKGGTTYTPDSRTAAQGGDLQPIVDLQPKFYGGFGNNFTYKAFSLSLLFQFNKQMGYNYIYSIYSQVAPNSNVPVQLLDRWRKTGDHTSFEKPVYGYSYPAYSATYAFTTSSGSYSDASYIRLKNVALAYALPAAKLKKLGIRDAHIYINAQNLLTITGYKVGDPEMPGRLYAIPMQRTVVGGLSFNF